jgi:hypothetical protein
MHDHDHDHDHEEIVYLPQEGYTEADEELVPELREWRIDLGQQVRLFDWITYTGDPRYLIGFMEYLWPRFIEHDGGVFLHFNFTEEGYREWRGVLPNDLPGIERVMNHVPLLELFQEPERQETVRRVQLQYIGERLQEMWQARLGAAFPDKAFVVDLGQGANLDDFAITFWQQVD